MSYGVVVPNMVQAQNIDTYTRNAKCATAVQNGYCVQLASMSSVAGEREVYVATQMSSGAGLQHLWMVADPEVVVFTTASGKQYKGLSPDPRDFLIAIGDVFTVFQPQIGDIITLSTDCISGTVATGDYAVATASQWTLAWSASGSVSGLVLHRLETTYISIADGTVGTSRTVAYRFEVTAVA